MEPWWILSISVHTGQVWPEGASLCVSGVGTRSRAPGWVARNFLNPKDKLKSMESPLSPAPLLPCLLVSAILPLHHPGFTGSPPPLPAFPLFPLSQFPHQPLPSSYCSPYTLGFYPPHLTPSLAPPSDHPSTLLVTVLSNTVLPPGIRFRKPHPFAAPPLHTTRTSQPPVCVRVKAEILPLLPN